MCSYGSNESLRRWILHSSISKCVRFVNLILRPCGHAIDSSWKD